MENNKDITIYDLMLVVQEGFEKIDKRLSRIEQMLTAEEMKKENLDERVSRIESKLGS